MSSLASAIDELAVEDLDAAAEAALADDLVEIRRAIDRLEAEWLRRLVVLTAAGRAATKAMASCRRSAGCAAIAA
jgi:hypothetical protein